VTGIKNDVKNPRIPRMSQADMLRGRAKTTYSPVNRQKKGKRRKKLWRTQVQADTGSSRSAAREITAVSGGVCGDVPWR